MQINGLVNFPIYNNSCVKKKPTLCGLNNPVKDTFVRTSFKGDCKPSIFNEISEIKSEEEYDSILKEIMSDSGWNHSHWDISGADKYQLGLMPYVGVLDAHFEINYFLRTGKLYNHEYYNNNETRNTPRIQKNRN